MQGTTSWVECNPATINPLATMGMQVSFILVVSHLFHLVLKPLGQPGPIAHILSGFVIGPSCLSRIPQIKKTFFFQELTRDYYETMVLFCRIIIMFLVGLETDIPYLLRNLRPATAVAAASSLVCTLFAAAITPYVYHHTEARGPAAVMWLILAVILSNAASPYVIRIAYELRFAATDFGRFAISSSLFCDIYSVVLLAISSRSKKGFRIETWAFLGCFAFLLVVLVIVLINRLTNWLNRRNRNRRDRQNSTEGFVILSIVVATAMGLEWMGYNSMTACFLIGSTFPKGGKTARTLSPKLNYSVHNFIFPVYLGYLGFLADVSSVHSLSDFGVVAGIVLLSLGGKIGGTLFACYRLKIPMREGVLLAFLMDLKGHVDFVTLGVCLQNQVITGQSFFSLMILAIVSNTLMVGPIISYMMRREGYLCYTHLPVECQEPEDELRVLACVHNPRPVSTIAALVFALKGSKKGPLAAYLLHLIELPQKANNPMYRQEEMNDENYHGSDDAMEINEAVDAFTAETGLLVHQMKAISPFQNMHSDVCDTAEELRASIVFLHFHKHRRIDGKMELGKGGIRTTNQKVLRNAKCSVGILVDRGITGASRGSGSDDDPPLHVAVLFFGGPDDRGALVFSRRLIMDSRISLTVIRFSPAASKKQQHKNVGATEKQQQHENVGTNVVEHREEGVSMAISDREKEREADSAVLANFYNKYVTSGKAGFVEKYAENGAETASALRGMAEMYTLFIVGKGGRGESPLTTGMSDWEECPELGAVGDLLASSDFNNSGSVLVIQQPRISNNDEDDDDE